MPIRRSGAKKSNKQRNRTPRKTRMSVSNQRKQYKMILLDAVPIELHRRIMFAAHRNGVPLYVYLLAMLDLTVPQLPSSVIVPGAPVTVGGATADQIDKFIGEQLAAEEREQQLDAEIEEEQEGIELEGEIEFAEDEEEEQDGRGPQENDSDTEDLKST